MNTEEADDMMHKKFRKIIHKDFTLLVLSSADTDELSTVYQQEEEPADGLRCHEQLAHKDGSMKADRMELLCPVASCFQTGLHRGRWLTSQMNLRLLSLSSLSLC